MKFCPTCQTRYDEEILRFCTKDGSPLVDEQTPNFIRMPSESLETPAEDFGEETVIRRKPPTNPNTIPTPLPDFEEESSYQSPRNSAERIIIPTAEQQRDQQVRSRAIPPYQPPPRSNTAKVVALTFLGTILALIGAGAVIWFLQNDTPSNQNTNTNANLSTIDTNLNTNLNISNSNLNLNANFNTNSNSNTNITNTNTNLKTPTPTPKPSPSASPTPSPSPNSNTNTNTTNANRPVNANRPTATPSPSRPTNTNTAPANRPVNAGVLNGRAVNLTTPAYPTAARTARASGRVTVEVTVDESGLVTSARATAGHPLLRQSAEAAARQSRFSPVKVSGEPTRATGTVIYNFVN